MKLAVVLGTRPEFIKLSHFLRQAKKKFEMISIHTGQHYDLNMSAALINELKLPEMDYQIKLPKKSFEVQLAKMGKELGRIFRDERPDCVLVQGDTNSAMMGALIGKRLGIRVIHVEAGCRSFDMNSPEEQNRKIIDSISALYLCADKTSMKNLKREGVKKNVHFSGSTVFDAASWASRQRSEVLKPFKLKREGYVVATLHRAENLEDLTGFQSKIDLINHVAQTIPVIFPVHPRTQKFLKAKKIKLDKKVQLIEPQTYVPFIQLLKDCRFVLSDSGGIQEEAAFFDRPCLILREATEWTRLVEKGKNFLIKKINNKTYKLIAKLLHDEKFYASVCRIQAPEIKTGATKKIIERVKSLNKA